MPKCLGIYIEDNVIKYAKVDKNKDNLKVENYNVVFYEKEKITSIIQKIISESYSTKDLISINISNELYNYFEVFSAFKQSDKAKSVDLDFELLCGEKKYNKDTLETRSFYRPSKDNPESERVIHIATSKENLKKRAQEFQEFKITTATPIATSIANLVNLPMKENNVLIVNIEKDTKVTTILDGQIYNIDIIPNGMGEVIESISSVENSVQKAYEVCKNTTIYTQETQSLQANGENEHLDEIMPVLYNIVEAVKEISETAGKTINKIYITGLGTVINNIDLYFQENIPNIKCEFLTPYFLEKFGSIQIPIKDYIEVNSAIALALEGLGLGNPSFNFKGKSALKADISLDSIKRLFSGLVDPSQPMTVFDKTMLRIVTCLLVGVVGYSLFSTSIANQISEKTKDIKNATSSIESEIDTINSQITKVKSGQATYDQLVTALTAINSAPEDYNSDNFTGVIIDKNAIPNLLNKIVYNIPTQVTITSIKNTNADHIVITAQAGKYQQLGFFRALISTEGILLNVKSTSGTRSGNVITITIEGDLP